jgi:uroporphyrinogen-III decarboxylase
MMTALERMQASLNHEEADRVPVWTLLDNVEVLRHFAGHDCDELIAADGQNTDLLVDTTVKACHELGVDVTFTCFTYVMNPFPAHAAETKTSSAHKSDWQSLDDLKDFHPDVPSYEEIESKLVPEFRRLSEKFAPHTVLVSQGSCCIEAAHVLGLELFSMAMYDDPSTVSRILEEYSHWQHMVSKVYATHDLGPAYQISCDIGYKGSLLFDPNFLRKEMIPRLKYELEPIKNAGKKVVLHSDGDITEFLDDLIDAGIDGVNPIEPTAGMDLSAVKKRYGKNLVFVGNGDPNVITYGDREAVRGEVKRCFSAAAAGGGYFFDTGAGEVMPGLPWENVNTLFEAIREFGEYPLSL